MLTLPMSMGIPAGINDQRKVAMLPNRMERATAEASARRRSWSKPALVAWREPDQRSRPVSSMAGDPAAALAPASVSRVLLLFNGVVDGLG
ncbi:MAG TPA: hypothetical protein VHA37_09955, partial [Candidatus Saccharimonadales bacterium]|nr:hypothetical protein [Candidatus Saccharimonadales bacterium]